MPQFRTTAGNDTMPIACRDASTAYGLGTRTETIIGPEADELFAVVGTDRQGRRIVLSSQLYDHLAEASSMAARIRVRGHRVHVQKVSVR